MNEQTVKDSVVLGDKIQVQDEELTRLRELSEEERHIEKKLLRKIDSLILPMVVLVYLMNYIDRYGPSLSRSIFQLEIVSYPPVPLAYAGRS